MHHEAQVEIGRQLLQWRAQGRTQVGADRMENPAGRYADPSGFERERRHLFRTRPLVVGFSAEVREPGQFLCSRDTDVPIVVVRTERGALKAFINACRHRGTLLVAEDAGRVDHQFVCPYHHWAYSTEGALAAVPGEFGFPELEREARALVALPVCERFGLVWVLARPHPAAGAPAEPGAAFDLGPHLERYLGTGLVEELAGFGFDRYHLHRRTVIPAAMNWKLMYDTFLEFYHAHYTHARTLRTLMERNLVHCAPLGAHYRMVAAKRSIAQLETTPETGWNLLEHAVVSYAVFPNTAINFHGDHVAVYRVFPDRGRIDAASWHFAMLLPEAPTGEKAARYFDKNFDYIVETGREDVAVGERIQQTLHSGANETFLYGGFETILSWFHRGVAEALAEDGARLD